MKKLIFLLIAVVITSALFIAPALADEPADDEDDFDYEEEIVPVLGGGGIGSGSASFSVSSTPSGAVATDLTTGESKSTPCVFTIHEGTQYWGVSHTIKISKSGYYDYTDYTGVLDDGDELYIIADLEPIVSDGTLSITSSPSDATVYVDGIYHGTTPIQVTENEGTHTIRIGKPGYDTYVETAVVTAGTITPVYAILSKQVTTGYVTISSTPSGADVYIDGTYRGDSPLTVLVTSGSHNVKVVKSGYSAYTTTVNVPAGGSSSVSASLASNADSYLNIVSYPSGAAVYVDGAYQGNTQYSSSSNPNYLHVGPLSSGSHTVSLTLDGYNKYTTGVNLAKNEARTISVTLTPITPVVATTSLYLASNPSGSSVYIDNVFKGYTPLILNEVPVGPHIVLVQHANYNDWSETINFQAGVPVEKTVTLSGGVVPTVPTQSPAPVLALLAGLAAVGLFALRRE
ncbi:MAG: PEGA domain-containing protein [Methanocorpusculum sp.]|nr:PEGA domain-containing protein [Methanocorpusculum sp.]